ncbi:Glycosyltransferase involved in cell wall bisynthesis [Mesorhizobium albiziae]|uniref:Glycosyltransferase involved in cell wall bisynthesis n=1 Tax=Neomesorhizobium albiziae TaxID=335020 RepID=A0A1I3YYU8_9HYPH|nr:glycosyltransferase family 4 protein [Mesorhizobium albiziae]GLS33180.1 colanic acid biosynthesis glycosyltransferase WcaL [Mesorhizobium albiziae]SFK37044.1 Glycosyltransferase involved in cell wall bisynthesis [Mesorhizobium albiziae]
MSNRRKIVVVLKGYPRLSETFIAQELLGLERAGMELVLVALRRPTDGKRHPVHDEIRAPVHYLPEYLHEEPSRVGRALLSWLPHGSFWKTLRIFAADLRRDPTRNRIRRFGQALVLAREWPEDGEWLHAHFAHTPASVTRYTSLLRGLPWTCSAHAKDIWTSQDWDLAAKLSSARWMVTCTRTGYDHLKSLANGGSNIHLSYHGLDLARFGHFEGTRPARDGSLGTDPVVVLSVGRAVEKKGYDVLLRAFALLPADLHWRFEHIGGGEQLSRLKALAESLGIAQRVSWKGALAQEDVLEHYRRSDIFALACRIAADGDRDGLPNVLVEAASQKLVCVSTNVSGVPELLTHDENGLVVASEDPQALARALERAIREPSLRKRLGDAAERRVRDHFDHNSSIVQLKSLFEREWQADTA